MLRPLLPATGHVLEIAAGGGQHASFFAAALPGLTWRPTDGHAFAVESLERRREQEGTGNLLPAVQLDAAVPGFWPAESYQPRPDAVVCINMVHISPWDATVGLFAGAWEVLKPKGLLFLYGPYREADTLLAPSNTAFDQSLKVRNPAWGLRDLADLDDLALRRGFDRILRVEMPANNLSLAYRRVGLD